MAIYLNNQIQYALYPEINNIKMKAIEHVAVQIKLGPNHITVISTYRPPNAKLPDTINDLTILFTALNKQNHFILSGDLNIDTSKDNHLATQYYDLLQTHHLQQYEII